MPRNSIFPREDLSLPTINEHKIDGEVFIIEVDNSASRAPKLHTRGKWQRGARLAESAVVQNPKISGLSKRFQVSSLTSTDTVTCALNTKHV
ncbi:unnamed protein product [Oikopleura dioica]|uniref:Uncharacterized protein n=1 Tax=Oikopleura dioica TaxID=34765 RepID=E4YHV3_OIKDI|nr:unnamed protein product [Oikopleura dioica]